MITPKFLNLRILVAIALVVIVGIKLWQSGYETAKQEDELIMLKAEAEWSDELKQMKDKKDAELHRVATGFQVRIASLEADTARIVAGHVADGKRLRLKLAQSGSGRTDLQSGCSPDGRADIDRGDVERILAVSQKGDAWIKALQETVRILSNENQKLRSKNDTRR